MIKKVQKNNDTVQFENKWWTSWQVRSTSSEINCTVPTKLFK